MVEQIDDARRGIAHGLDGRLVAQKVATRPYRQNAASGIALAFKILGGINTTLRADRVRSLHRDDGEQVHVPAHLSDFDDGGEASQTAADHDYLGCDAMGCDAMPSDSIYRAVFPGLIGAQRNHCRRFPAEKVGAA